MVYFQHNRSIGCHHAVGFRFFIDDTAHHHVDDVILGAVFCNQRSDVCPVTHDGNAVRDYFYLIHTMGDIDNTKLLFAQIADNLEEFLDFRLCQRCRGLIENDDFRLVGNSLGNFTHLLLANRKISHLFRRIDVYAQLVKQFFRFDIHARIVN